MKNKGRREFSLDDGTVLTVDDMVEKTGWARGTCYARLSKWTNPLKVFKALSSTQRGRLYVLDDGSEWTSQSLAEFLDCKVSTAGTRLSMMKGESKRILAPVRGGTSYYDARANNSTEVQKRVRGRMWYDPLGHWELLNKVL